MNNNKQLLHSPNLSTRTSINFMHHVGQDETLFISQATNPFNNITTTATTLNHSPTLSIASPITSSYDSSSNSSTPLTSSPKLTSLTSPTTLSYVNGQQQHDRNNNSSKISCHHQPNGLLDDETYFQLSEYLSQNTDNNYKNNNYTLSLEEKKIMNQNEIKKELSLNSSSILDKKNGLQIRVIGAPDKSRVETQTRLCIQLLTTHGTKVTSWPCLTLPERLLARSRLKKSFQQQQQQQQQQCSDNDSIHQQMILSDESSLLSKTIYLDAKVVCASQPDQPVKVCSGCIQRERKRAERSKNQHKNNNNNNAAGPRSIIDTIPEQDRILLFNCGPMVNFSSGDAILPTRITCYCRHHNEKLGFRVQFTMKNGRGDIIAMGMSPPILITDDHKSTRQKNRKRNRNDDESKNSIKNSSQQQQKVRKLPSNKTVIPVTPAASRRNSLSIDLVDTHFPSLESTDPNDLSILDSQSSSPIIPTHGFHSSSLPTPGEERNNPYGNSLSSFFPLPPLSSSSISPTLSTTLEPIPCSTTTTIEHPHISSEHISSPTSSILSPSPTNLLAPQLERLVPAQGPTYGGCEVTVLGSNFYRGLTCLFGEHQATTVFWNPNTLVCVLPPATHPGPVVVSFKQHSLILEGHDVPLFTYYDANDQALLELALQVVGLKMTGKLQDAKQIAMRIVQGGDNLLQQQQQQQHQNDNNNHSHTLNASNFYFAQSCSNNASGAHNNRNNRSGAFISDSLIFLAMRFNGIRKNKDTNDLTLLEDNMIQVINQCQVTAHDLLHVRTPVTHHTLLHLAVWGNYTKLAMKIINLCPQVLHANDRNGIVPLALAHIKGHKTSIVLDTMLQANMTNQSLATVDLIDSHQSNNDKRHQDLSSTSSSSSSIMLQDPSLLLPYTRTTPMTTENLILLSTPTVILPEEAEIIKKEGESTFKSIITTTRSKPVSDILPYSFCSSVTPLLVSM